MAVSGVRHVTARRPSMYLRSSFASQSAVPSVESVCSSHSFAHFVGRLSKEHVSNHALCKFKRHLKTSHNTNSGAAAY